MRAGCGAQACMRIVKGSHKLGLLDHNTTEEGNFNAEPYERELWEDDASLAKVMPRAGGLSIHHVRLSCPPACPCTIPPPLLPAVV